MAYNQGNMFPDWDFPGGYDPNMLLGDPIEDQQYAAGQMNGVQGANEDNIIQEDANFMQGMYGQLGNMGPQMTLPANMNGPAQMQFPFVSIHTPIRLFRSTNESFYSSSGNRHAHWSIRANSPGGFNNNNMGANLQQNSANDVGAMNDGLENGSFNAPNDAGNFGQALTNGNGVNGDGQIQVPNAHNMDVNFNPDMMVDDETANVHSRMGSNDTTLSGGSLQRMSTNDSGHAQNGGIPLAYPGRPGIPFHGTFGGGPQFHNPFPANGMAMNGMQMPMPNGGMPNGAMAPPPPHMRHSYPGAMNSVVGGNGDLAAAARQQRSGRGIRASLPEESSSRQDAPRHSRADAPVPISALPRQNSMNSAVTTPTDVPVTTAASGPMRSSVTLPPRPRPGRRPLQDTGVQGDRRREQNRQAQRNFRDKRQQRVQELENELAEQRRLHQEEVAGYRRQLEEQRTEINDLRARNADLENEVTTLRRELAEAREEIATLRRELAEARAQRGAPAPNTAPDDGPPRVNYMFQPEDDHLAVDFTQKFASKHSKQNIAYDSPYSEMTDGQDCGFCTDKQNCVCAQEAAANAAMSQQKASALEQPRTMPGGCDACLADPERAQACKDSYKNALQYPTFRTSTGEAPRLFSERTTSLPSIVPRDESPPSKKARISCSQAIDRFAQSGQRLASISELFGNIHAFPATGSDGQGFAVEEHEAAEVLQNLHQQDTSPKAKKN